MIAHEEFMSEAVQSHGVGYYDLRAKWGKRPTMQAGISYGDFSHVHMHTEDRPRSPFQSRNKQPHEVGFETFRAT